jgi:hypothetical protein
MLNYLNEILNFKAKTLIKNWDWRSVVEYLLSIWKALWFIPSTEKEKEIIFLSDKGLIYRELKLNNSKTLLGE